MTLGQYPLQVPEKFRLPEQYFSNDVDFPKFKDIGMDLGVAENQKAGGTCVDDFNNDGYLHKTNGIRNRNLALDIVNHDPPRVAA